MKKIAIVNQRYGKEINGGSEYYTRLISERLKKYYEVEIITTTALDYKTWSNYYNEGETTVDGIKVKRFIVEKPTNPIIFKFVNVFQRVLNKLGGNIDEFWIKEQGPYCPDAVEYLLSNQNNYYCIIFVTYLFYITAKALPKLNEKAVFIPTAHDERQIYYGIYKDVFEKAKAIGYLTEAEKKFVEKLFDVKEKKNMVIGAGIDITLNGKTDEKYLVENNLERGFILYAGRIDAMKGCKEMIDYWNEYVNKSGTDIKLVLIGKKEIEFVENGNIKYLGFVSEDEKRLLMEKAEYLWLPSRYESLSLVVLEAMALGTPCIVNGNCEVLKEHAIKSNAAFYYENKKGCIEQLDFCIKMDKNEYLKYSNKAKEYVEENYVWDKVEKKLIELIEY